MVLIGQGCYHSCYWMEEKKRVENCTLSKQEKAYSKGFLVLIRHYKITEYLGVRTKSSVMPESYAQLKEIAQLLHTFLGSAEA